MSLYSTAPSLPPTSIPSTASGQGLSTSVPPVSLSPHAQLVWTKCDLDRTALESDPRFSRMSSAEAAEMMRLGMLSEAKVFVPTAMEDSGVTIWQPISNPWADLGQRHRSQHTISQGDHWAERSVGPEALSQTPSSRSWHAEPGQHGPGGRSI